MEADRPQHDGPTACVTAQQYSSATFISLSFHSRREKTNRRALKNIIISILFFFFKKNCFALKLICQGVPVIHHIYAEGLRKIAETFCRDIWSPDQDLHPDPPKYEGAPTTVPQCGYFTPAATGRLNCRKHDETNWKGLGRKHSWHIKKLLS